MSDPDAEDEDVDVLPSPSLGARLKARLRKIADWRRDELLRKLYRNALMLLAGEGFAALIGLVAIALTTRGLGTLEWGVLATIMAFTHLTGNLIKFQTWQAVVKFGADSLARDDVPALQRLVRFTTMLDVTTSLLAAGICFVAMPFFMRWVGLGEQYREFAMVYSAAALFTISATPTGVLRLFDRFDLLSALAPLGPILRVGGCAVAYFTHGGLWAFGMVWLASTLLDRAILVVVGWRELGRRGYRRGLWGKLGDATAGHAGLWRFAIAGNLQSSVNVLTKEFDTLLVAKLLAPEAAGLWALAKRFGSVIGGPARLFVVSVFPQLAKLWAAHDYRLFRRLVLRSSLTGGVAGILGALLFLAIGEHIIVLIAGAGFLGAFWPTALMMASRAITLFASPMTPAMLAMNRPMKSLKIAVVLAVIYLPLLALLTSQLGLVGAGIARVLGEVLPLAVITGIVMRTIARHIRRVAERGAPPVAQPAQ
jgi:O-antigen/teichoic acid export membrane protein